MHSIAILSAIFTLVVPSRGTFFGGQSTSSEDGTLLLVHALFRHGNRTPDDSTYPLNPYGAESFYMPYGYGQLTDEGKRTEYKIGTTLRTRYNDFLGDMYTLNSLSARTTNVPRTKASLELMLAGLWPPAWNQKWNWLLNWQPIPYSYLETTKDKELQGRTACKNYQTLYDEVFANLTAAGQFDKYKPVYEYLSNHTGKDIETPNDVAALYFGLVTMKEFGYSLEAWTNSVFPNVVTKIAKDYYYLSTNTSSLRKLSGGFLLKKIISDSKAKIDGNLPPDEQQRKMYLYSAHEINVASFLGTLGVYPDDIPAYGSHVLVELRLVNDVYGFKIFYQDWLQENPKPMTIPGCTEFCPFDQFVKLLSDVIPEDSDCQM